MPIHFYRTAERYGCFSNFSRHSTKVYGLRWETTEHTYQAMKFFPHRDDLVRRVQQASTPREAATLGRTIGPLNPGWERSPHSVLSFRLADALHPLLQPDDARQRDEPLFNRLKDLVMYEIVYAKVMQHPLVRSRLLETGAEPIVEASPKDRYWGWGADEAGENKLGRIFMAVRNALVHGAQTRTAFGKPERVPFVCSAEYPWQDDYGPGEHPHAESVGRTGRDYETYRCPHCDHRYEVSVHDPV